MDFFLNKAHSETNKNVLLKVLTFIILIWFGLMPLLFTPPITQAQTTDADSVVDLNKKLQEKKNQIKKIETQQEAYRKKIKETQSKSITLNNQISILDSGIETTKLDIERRLLEVEQVQLELKLIEAKIQQANGNLEDLKGKMGEILRNINRYNQKKYLAVIATSNSFADFFDELYRYQSLNGRLLTELNTIKQLKQVLTDNQSLLTDKKEEIEVIKDELGETKSSLEDEKRLKERLLSDTKASEAEFQKLLRELKQAEAAMDSEIVTLEKSLRQKLEEADKLGGDTGKFNWPINPSRGISAGFHDPDYPYRYLFEHAGIDIRASQGTPIKAVASGYVVKAFNGGMGIQPSYIMLLHPNGLSTVYMHVSTINVAAETFVTRGQIIGSSGGAPGTSGAGRWTTGPHLHFEVRFNGVPVNPLNYLP